MTTDDGIGAFFDGYRTALLARDGAALAALYTVPALAVFPTGPMAVTDPAQTQALFEASFAQYADVTDTAPAIRILEATPAVTWADVTWSHDNGATEHLVYQLVPGPGGWRIAVLTPLP